MKIKSPATKMVEKLLFDHRKSNNKTYNTEYTKFLPYSKKYITNWAASLFGPPKILILESIQGIEFPIKFDKRYPALLTDTWKILNDPTLRQLVELESCFGYSVEEIHNRISSIIKPRKICQSSIKQYLFYFWNFKCTSSDMGEINPLVYFESNHKSSKAYQPILKYLKDKNGREKYQNIYSIGNSSKPDLKNISRSINLSVMGQIEAFEINDMDRFDVLSKITLNNSKVYKNLQNDENEEITFLNDYMRLRKNSNEKSTET